jgi:uncharacterized protein (UPF0147 family)
MAYVARKIKNRYVKFIEIDDYYSIIKEMSEDQTVPKYASQLVYMTSANFNSEIESKIIYSILQKSPNVPMFTGWCTLMWWMSLTNANTKLTF